MGSRALGNRSIIANPKIKNMKKDTQYKNKKKEFQAVCTICFKANNWFENYFDDPFMMTVCKVVKSKVEIIPQ